MNLRQTQRIIALGLSINKINYYKLKCKFSLFSNIRLLQRLK